MDIRNKEEHFFQQLFQDQKKQESELTPGFQEIFSKARIKYQKMKNIRLFLALAVGLLLLTGLALLTNNNDDQKDEIKVAKAGLSLFDQLENDGKIITHDIRFAFDRADLLPESMPIIQSVADMMKEHPEIRLRIGGHSDDQGSDSYNEQLSGLRAEAVRQALVTLSVDGNRLQAQGYGETQPVADNSSEQGRAQNRRVEFVPF